MNPGIIIPWRLGSSRLRERALANVRIHLAGSGFPLYVSDCEEPWSPGAARNRGAAVKASWDPLLFVDADTLVPWPQLWNAAYLAMAGDGLVYGYTVYVRCAPTGADTDDVHEGSASLGAAAISRSCFEQLGGFDEEYRGWGYEDLDFAQRAAALWPLRRVDGLARHLWHGERRADGSPADVSEALAGLNRARWISRSVPAAT